jgi:hypothetical protein
VSDPLHRRAVLWTDTIDPTVDEDRGRAFRVGDIWVNTSSGDRFILIDDTVGAADWSALAGGGGGAVSSVHGRTGAVVGVLGDYAGIYQPLDTDLTAVAGLTGTGIVVRDSTTPTYTTRTIVAGSGVTVTNGDGIGGNPTISAGAPFYTRVTKPSDTGRNTTTTMTADPDLTISLPNGTWGFRCEAYAYGDANADWRLAMETSDAGAVLQWHWNLGNVFDCLIRNHTGLNCSLSGTAVPFPERTRIMQLGGKVTVTGGPHDLYLEWAQFTSTGVDVSVLAGSWLEVWQVI